MAPMAIAALVQAGLGVAQMIKSSAERKKADKEFDNYKVPGSIYSMMDEARRIKAEREIPGADLYRSNAMASSLRMLEATQRTAESPSDVLGAVGAIDKNYKDFETNMAIASASNKHRNRTMYMDVLQRLAQYEAQKWMYNEYMPYVQKMTGAAQTGASGAANIGSAANSVLNLSNQQFQMDKMNKELELWKMNNGIFGGNPYEKKTIDWQQGQEELNFG